MGLETIFYVMAITFMSLMFILMIGMIVLVFYIKIKVDRMYQKIEEKINFVSKIARDPSDIALNVGTAVAKSAFKGVKRMMQKR